jgi:hypothetical protein
MQKMNKLGALRRVEFIWINRDTGSFEWFQSLLKQLEDVCPLFHSSTSRPNSKLIHLIYLILTPPL